MASRNAPGPSMAAHYQESTADYPVADTGMSDGLLANDAMDIAMHRTGADGSFQTEKKPVHGSSDDISDRRFYLTPEAHYRQYALLFVLGLINNLGYVVVLSSAKSLAEGFHKENLIGALQWANVGFGLFAKLINTVFFLKSSFVIRMIVSTALLASGLLLTALSTAVGFELAFLGILLIGAASAFGESVLMGYFKLIDPALVGAWSSGTGGSGVGGSGLYLILHTFCHLNNRTIFLMLLPLSVVYYVCFFLMHTRYAAGSGKPLRTFAEAAADADAASLNTASGAAGTSGERGLLDNELGWQSSSLAPPAATNAVTATPAGKKSSRGVGSSASKSGRRNRAAYFDDDAAPAATGGAEASRTAAGASATRATGFVDGLGNDGGLLLGDSSGRNSPSLGAAPSSYRSPILPFGESPRAGPRRAGGRIGLARGSAAGAGAGPGTGAGAGAESDDDEFHEGGLLAHPSTLDLDMYDSAAVAAATRGYAGDHTGASGGDTLAGLSLNTGDASTAIVEVAALDKTSEFTAETPAVPTGPFMPRALASLKLVWSPAVQLALVYFFEYVVCVGFASVSNPHPHGWAQTNAYEILSLCYQLGVWVSRSSIGIIQIKRIEIITFVQGANFVFWLLHVLFGIMNVYVQFVAMFWVGLYAGAMYVNVFYFLLRDPAYEQDRELSVNIVAIFINLGIMMSSGFTLLADATFLAKFHDD